MRTLPNRSLGSNELRPTLRIGLLALLLVTLVLSTLSAAATGAPVAGSLHRPGPASSEHEAPRAPTVSSYWSNFTERGLAKGTSWAVTLGGSTLTSTTGTISFSEPNGTYPFTVATIQGQTPIPSSGSVVVNGPSPAPTAVTFPGAGSAFVTFNETGLPGGSAWSVTFNGALHRSGYGGGNITVAVANGTIPFTVTPVTGYNAYPPSGNVTVAGVNQVVPIFFGLPHGKYPVSFHETGLGYGVASWSVTLNGATLSSATATITFSVANGTYAFRVGNVSGYSAAPSTGSFGVNGASVRQNIVFTAIPGDYPVDFSETGLPAGTNWIVTFNGVTENATATTGFGGGIDFAALNGSYSFSVTPVPGYTAVPASGTITVNGAPVFQNINFLPPGDYAVTFQETGLPAGTAWTVTLVTTPGFSLNADITFTEKNGTYAFTVGTVAGYTATPNAGNVTVKGSSVTVPITFAPYVPTFRVWFNETGLPTGTSWSATVGTTTLSSLTASILFGLANGSYTFSVPAAGDYAPTPSSGGLTVAGVDQSQAVLFAYVPPGPATYTATFSGSGLPYGATWVLTFNGTPFTLGATSNVHNFTGLRNNTYGFSVAAPSGYSASPSAGSVTIAGADAVRVITFTAAGSVAPTLYDVSFAETGLSSGTSWTVTFNGTPSSSSTASILFQARNGTYTFSLTAPSGYTASTTSGSLTVTGAPTTESITFTATSGGNGGGGSGSSSGGSGSSLGGGLSGDSLYLLLGVVVLVVAALGAFLVLRSRGKQPRKGAVAMSEMGASAPYAAGGSTWAPTGDPGDAEPAPTSHDEA